jgi:hydroxyethylthiazole kinase
VAEDLARLRQAAPLTQCVTNIVVAGFTANVLLAVGASPAMVDALDEIPEFVPIAQGLLVNIGTLANDTPRAAVRAAAVARASGTPWVLDPVAAGATKFRSALVTEILEHRPTVIKGNASEILALAGAQGGGKGPDSTADSADAVPAAITVARQTDAVVAITGVVDYATDGAEVVAVPGGHDLMPRVTGTGCSLGGVIAAFLGAGADPLRATVAGLAVFAAAGERASQGAAGPGSFAAAFLDELYRIGTEW